MTAAEDVHAIADEMIAHWIANDVTAEDAWRDWLQLPWGWGTTWREVRRQLLRWQLEYANPFAMAA